MLSTIAASSKPAAVVVAAMSMPSTTSVNAARCRAATSPPRRLPYASPQRRPLVVASASASASSASPRTYHGRLDASGKKFAVVVARFNDLVTKLLAEGAVGALERHGASPADIDVVWVPGSFELPVTAKAMGASGKYDAVVAVGAVVRGATTHYDAVVSGATSGLLSAGLDTGVPTIFTVLTCDTMEQALDRAGGKVGNKGYEGAVTAVEMACLLEDLRKEGKAK